MTPPISDKYLIFSVFLTIASAGICLALLLAGLVNPWAFAGNAFGLASLAFTGIMNRKASSSDANFLARDYLLPIVTGILGTIFAFQLLSYAIFSLFTGSALSAILAWIIYTYRYYHLRIKSL